MSGFFTHSFFVLKKWGGGSAPAGQVCTCGRFAFGFYVLIFIVRIIIFSSNNVSFHVQPIRRVRSTAACSRWTAVIPSSGSAPAGKLPDGSFVIFSVSSWAQSKDPISRNVQYYNANTYNIIRSAYALKDETRSTPLYSAQGDTLLSIFLSGALAKSRNPINRNVNYIRSVRSTAACSRWTAVIPSEALGIP